MSFHIVFPRGCRSRSRILVFAAALSLLALPPSCQRPDIVFDETTFSSTSAEIEPLSDPIRVVFPSSGGTASLRINATQKWIVGPVNGRAGWCSVSPDSGKKGTSTITITVPGNDAYDERSATYVFTSDIITRSIIITQKQKDAVLLSPSRLEVPAAGGVFSIDVRHNVRYEAYVEGESGTWLSITGTKALSSGSITLQVAANEDLPARHGRVVVKSSAGEEAVDVYQDGGEPAILLSGHEFTVPARGDVVVIEVRSNVDYEYDVVEGAEWIHEVTTKSMSSHTLHFAVDENAAIDERRGMIRFLDRQYGVTEDVAIIQRQRDSLAISQGEYSVDADGGVIAVEVLSNVDFKYDVSEGKDWITAVTTKGLSARSVEFDVAASDEPQTRTGTIVFSDAAETLLATVTVHQAPKTTVLRVRLSAGRFPSPVFHGKSVLGTSDWGDGTVEPYDSTAVHGYGSEGGRTATFTAYGAESVTITNMEGVEHLDLTKFLKKR